MHGFVSYRCLGEFGRYRPSRVGAWSLRSNRAWLELGRYVATEPCSCSVATLRPSRVLARSLRCDRAVFLLGRYVTTELGMCVVRWPYLTVAFGQSVFSFDESTEIKTRFYRKALCKDSFYEE
ncbi:hypothetical protein F2Q69_00021838 [Brassica cretica]|uniref:Uncharacterized protein n=1 Tax=Brassica cretica TaxID=69181 RepID=A0A8S9Q1D3_BRACR|nr:hypothetical protein F2Q69_00021838 [Brassica cretica]